MSAAKAAQAAAEDAVRQATEEANKVEEDSACGLRAALTYNALIYYSVCYNIYTVILFCNSEKCSL